MGRNPGKVDGKLFRLLLEYMKDSSRSDSQMAKVLGVSKTTISRMKRKLIEKELVEEFSVLPNLSKIGYEIMAFSCVKFKPEKIIEIETNAKEWAEKNPQIIFSSRTQGMGMDALTISVHKSYADYDHFVKSNKGIWGDLMEESHHLLIDLKGNVTKPFSLKYLAEKKKK